MAAQRKTHVAGTSWYMNLFISCGVPCGLIRTDATGRRSAPIAAPSPRPRQNCTISLLVTGNHSVPPVPGLFRPWGGPPSATRLFLTPSPIVAF